MVLVNPMVGTTQRPDAPASGCPLAQLPVEILEQIFEYLVPEPPEIGESKPVGYDKMVPGEAWYDFTRCRRGLWSLALVSRNLSAISRPLLYRVVAVLDEDGMLLLLRTLTEHLELGHCTRYFSCHLTLTRDSVVRETRRSFGRFLRTFNPNAPGLQVGSSIGRALAIIVLALPVLSTPAGDFDGVPQVLLFFLLTLLPKLETLMIQLPICDDHPEYTVLFEKIGNAGELMQDAKSAPPFQHIETLLLQGDPELLEHFESDDCSCDVPEVWGCQARNYWPLFDVLPKLDTLEVSTDDGIWTDMRRGVHGKSAPYLKRIRHIYLHNSIACPRNLNQVLKNAPSLQTLYMTPRREVDFDHGPGGDSTHAHPESLDTALLERPKRLRHLDVAWFDCRGYESLIGPEGRLTSIAEQAHLEKLCVQLCVLYGSDPANLLTPLADLLPPSLVELTLEEWWWDDIEHYDDMEHWMNEDAFDYYQAKRDYRAKVVGILERFAMDCPTRLPRLRKLSFLTKIPSTWAMGNSIPDSDGAKRFLGEGGVPMESHFEGVKRLLGGSGVDFLVDEA